MAQAPLLVSKTSSLMMQDCDIVETVSVNDMKIVMMETTMTMIHVVTVVISNDQLW